MTHHHKHHSGDISSEEIRRQFDSIRRILMNHEEQVNELRAKMAEDAAATAALIEAFKTEKGQIADLTARLEAVTQQLAAALASGQIADDTGALADITAQITAHVADINAVLNPPAPVESTPEAPVEPAPEAPVETPAV